MIPDRDPDFEAEIRILTEAEGGRRTPPLQGIRWDLRYADDPPDASIYMIWPWFLDEGGVPLPEKTPLSGRLRARMFVLVEDMLPYHKSRLSVGTGFYCVEDRRICTHGRATGLSWT